MKTNYLCFPQFKQTIFDFGPISFHWYGLMYLIGFIFSIKMIFYNIKNYNKNICRKEIKNLLINSFLGLIIGGRIGYMLFYNFSLFLNQPLTLFKIWNGGMSFHGGLIGVIIVLVIHSNYSKYSFFFMSDLLVPTIPFGLGLGRIGNFINGELWGRVAIDIPWAMLFPNSKKDDILFLLKNPYLQDVYKHFGALPRHPSQIYEFFLEGILLYIIINIFIKKNRPTGSVSGLFLVLYGVFRIFVECFRQPDIHIGMFINIFTMGQILSIPMIIFGIIIIIKSFYFNIKKIK